MPWIKHPAYVPVRNKLIQKLRQRTYLFGRSLPLVFLCGGLDSPRRKQIAEFLRRNTDALVFFAEDVWLEAAKTPAADALAMEKGLAELADVVMIVVESPGSFAELGAFSLHDGLREKLLPILDKRYISENSFINNGPIRTIDTVSNYKPSIYTDFEVILRCSAQLEQRLTNVPKRLAESLTPERLRASRKHLLLFVIELVKLLYPASIAHIRHYVDKVLGRQRHPHLDELLQLGVALELLISFDYKEPSSGSPTRYFAPRKVRTLLRNPSVSHSSERARIVGVMQLIPAASKALQEANRARRNVAD